VDAMEAGSTSAIFVGTGGTGTAAALTGVHITDNLLNPNNGNGIYVYNDQGALKDIQVSGNTVVAADTGILVEANDAASHTDMVVCNNAVSGCLHDAILLDLGATTGILLGASVSNNVAEGFGSSAASSGIEVIADDVHGLSVMGNTVHSSEDGCTGMLFALGGAVTHGSWIGNNIRMTGGAAPTGFKYDAGAGGTQLYVSFTGNNVFVNGAGNAVVQAGAGWGPDFAICANNTSNAGAAAGSWGAAATVGSFSDAFGANTTTTGNWA
jgi:hypothetical protein